MTRKDYELIARAMRITREDARADLHPQAVAMWEESCYALAASLANDNASFDRARFLAACGVQS
jgi:hypothetical protein